MFGETTAAAAGSSPLNAETGGFQCAAASASLTEVGKKIELQVSRSDSSRPRKVQRRDERSVSGSFVGQGATSVGLPPSLVDDSAARAQRFLGMWLAADPSVVRFLLEHSAPCKAACQAAQGTGNAAGAARVAGVAGAGRFGVETALRPSLAAPAMHTIPSVGADADGAAGADVLARLLPDLLAAAARASEPLRLQAVVPLLRVLLEVHREVLLLEGQREEGAEGGKPRGNNSSSSRRRGAIDDGSLSDADAADNGSSAVTRTTASRNVAPLAAGSAGAVPLHLGYALCAIRGRRAGLYVSLLEAGSTGSQVHRLSEVAAALHLPAGVQLALQRQAAALALVEAPAALAQPLCVEALDACPLLGPLIAGPLRALRAALQPLPPTPYPAAGVTAGAPDAAGADTCSGAAAAPEAVDGLPQAAEAAAAQEDCGVAYGQLEGWAGSLLHPGYALEGWAGAPYLSPPGGPTAASYGSFVAGRLLGGRGLFVPPSSQWARTLGPLRSCLPADVAAEAGSVPMLAALVARGWPLRNGCGVRAAAAAAATGSGAAAVAAGQERMQPAGEEAEVAWACAPTREWTAMPAAAAGRTGVLAWLQAHDPQWLVCVPYLPACAAAAGQVGVLRWLLEAPEGAVEGDLGAAAGAATVGTAAGLAAGNSRNDSDFGSSGDYGSNGEDGYGGCGVCGCGKEEDEDGDGDGASDAYGSSDDDDDDDDANDASDAAAAMQAGALQWKPLQLQRGPRLTWAAVADPAAVAAAAAGAGHLSALRYLASTGCPLDARTVTAAARGGHLEVLAWARAQGCPWDAEACLAAAGAGQLAALRWLRAQGPPCPWDARVLACARWKGHVAVEAWAREHGRGAPDACAVEEAARAAACWSGAAGSTGTAPARYAAVLAAGGRGSVPGGAMAGGTAKDMGRAPYEVTSVDGGARVGVFAASTLDGYNATTAAGAPVNTGSAAGIAAHGNLLPLEEALAEALMGTEPLAYVAASSAAGTSAVSPAAVRAAAAAVSEPSVAYVCLGSSVHGPADATLGEAARAHFGPSLESVLLTMLQAPLSWLASAGGIAGIMAGNSSSGFCGGSELSSPVLLPRDAAAGAGGRTQMQLDDGDTSAEK